MLAGDGWVEETDEHAAEVLERSVGCWDGVSLADLLELGKEAVIVSKVVEAEVA